MTVYTRPVPLDPIGVFPAPLLLTKTTPGTTFIHTQPQDPARMSIHVASRTTHPTWLPSLLGLFIAVGPAATDMYLPAFPAVEASFGTAPGTAQLTLATWFAGLAVGQITQGTLSDRFGRRIPLMRGFSRVHPQHHRLRAGPQPHGAGDFPREAAFGASAGMVIARAVVRDLSEGQAAAIMMSRLVLVMGVAPILAPTIGGAILAFAHWRFIFWLLAIYGTACAITAWKVLPETLPRGAPHPTQPRRPGIALYDDRPGKDVSYPCDHGRLRHVLHVRLPGRLLAGVRGRVRAQSVRSSP